MTKETTGAAMRECTEMFNQSGEHIATIGFNEFCGLWQIVVVQRKEDEFFCPSKEVAFSAWHHEFDPETGFPQSASRAGFDAGFDCVLANVDLVTSGFRMNPTSG